MSISMYDDAQAFPLIRKYFTLYTPMEGDEIEETFDDDMLRRYREGAPQDFEEALRKAEKYISPELPLLESV